MGPDFPYRAASGVLGVTARDRGVEFKMWGVLMTRMRYVASSYP